MYFLAINRVKPEVEPEAIGAIIPAHIEWTRQRIADSVVVQAGKWGASCGVCIIKADNEADAAGILQEDPIVQSGLFSVEIKQFYPDVKTAIYE